ASLFMLFQYPNMARNGLPPISLLGLVVAYALMGINTNLLAAVIYAFVAGNSKRRKRVYDALALSLLVMLLLGVWTALKSDTMLDGVVRFLGSDNWNYIPVFGWARGLAIAFATSDFAMVALFMALMAAGIGGTALLLVRTDMDYYEDVLLAAERANQAREDARAGRIAEQGEVSRRIKRNAGPLKGRGAMAFTFRILREQSRRGIGMLDMGTLGAAAGPLFSLIFFDTEMIADAGLWPVLIMTMWLMIFLQMQSSFARELSYAPIYLAPVSSFQKLIGIMLPGVIKSMADAVVFAACIYFFFGASVFHAAATWLIYISIAFLFSAGLLLVERILGASRNKVLVMMVYLILLLVLAIPGVFLAQALTASEFFGYMIYAAYNIFIGCLVVFLCRNILHQMDVA
ncbi:putative ABC exporter domain-containing protein, partial [Christensenellaceae bacterium OttesenSCG-928-M15]|nr:putative ABC exporter domain-containing protein [Christensenellaceae bacterium OttesenSCG-928-M15]